MTRLFLVSFAALFFEMAAIRWLNASVAVLAYFNNLILIGSFFGLGLGCLLAKRRASPIRWWAPALLAMVAVVVLLRRYGIEISYTGDHIFAPDDEYYADGLVTLSLAALGGVFVNVGFFVMLGIELGRRLEEVGDPLRAYAWDIGGSLTGVLAFAALSGLGTPPHVWYAAGALALLTLVPARRALNAAAAVAALALMLSTASGADWSPYYKVETRPVEGGHQILVDNVRIQDAHDLENPSAPGLPWVPYYQLPYHFIRPESVLILGAGSGNEAVMARAMGATTVHAVEIDPVIAGFGRTLHPNRPYERDGVTIVVDDARAFIENTDATYDLVVMSALDSHKQVAGMSSLRLESFVYTVEGFARMRERVAPGGVFCLSVSSYRPWIVPRVHASLTRAFGRPPQLFSSGGMAFVSTAFVIAPDGPLQRLPIPGGAAVSEVDPPAVASVGPATDDWPHLYLEGRRLPPVYLGVLAIMALLSTALVVRADPSVARPNLHYFLLGAAFMLLQTRGVTQMALLFGSTWNVNAIVVAAILATILLGNELVRRNLAPRRRTGYVLLAITLLVGWLLPLAPLLQLPLAWRVVAASVVAGLPILWAALIFSTSFRDETDVGRAFGSNLLGVVVGGCLEYASMIVGLNALYLVALALYGASAAVAPRPRALRA